MTAGDLAGRQALLQDASRRAEAYLAGLAGRAVAPLPACAAEAMRTYCRHAEEQAYVNAPWYKQLESLRRSILHRQGLVVPFDEPMEAVRAMVARPWSS